MLCWVLNFGCWLLLGVVRCWLFLVVGCCCWMLGSVECWSLAVVWCWLFGYLVLVFKKQFVSLVVGCFVGGVSVETSVTDVQLVGCVRHIMFQQLTI